MYVIARKALEQNSRIFKQAKSLTDAGYEVVLVGIRSTTGKGRESKDGYTILRVRLDPIHARLPRTVNRSLRQTEMGLMRAPGALWRKLQRVLVLAFAREPRDPAGSPDAVHPVIKSDVAGAPSETSPQRPPSRSFRLLRLPFRGLARLVAVLNTFFTVTLRKVLGRFLFPLRSLDFYKRVYILVTRDLPPPDIVHANDLDALLVAFLLARRYRVPLVYDAQELYTGIHTLPAWYRQLAKVQERVLIHKADRVIVVNHAIADVMERMYRRKIDEVVLNCAPYEDMVSDGDAPTIRERVGVHAGEPILLYSGGLMKQRGIEQTIRALQHLDRGVLVILGQGTLKEELLALVEAEGVSDRVFFTDYVPYREVPRFISSADLGIIPYMNVGINHYLCSPSKLFHYIMAGLPVACSDFPFLRKIVVENDIGAVFDPSDPRSVAAAIERIIVDKDRYARLQENLVDARRKYCWEEEERRFLDVYRSLE